MATIAEELAKAAITDTLVRAESPIAAPWVKMNPGTSAGKCNAAGASEGYTPVTSFATGEDDCYYSTSAFASSGTTYIYGILTLTRIGSSERQTGVWLCRDEGTPVTVQNGYYLRMEKKVPAGEIKYTIEKWVGGTPEVIKEFSTTEYVVGSQIAFVVGNGTAYMFGRVVEGSGEFAEKMSIATATYSKGYSGLRAKGTGEMCVKNFRTGTFTLGGESPKNIRRFATESDVITLAKGNLENPMSHADHGITFVLLMRPSGSNIGRPFVCGNWIIFSSGLNPTINGAESTSAATALEKNGWNIYVVTISKQHAGGNGSNQARVHNYKVASKTWAHAETANQSLNSALKGGVTTIGGKTGAISWEGDIAAVMCIPSYLTDAEVESLASVSSLGEWNKFSPSALWFLSQKEVAELLEDQTGFGANQTERTGTTVVAEAPPIPYGTTLSKAPAVLKMLVGGVIKQVRRWFQIPTELRSR